MFLLLKKDVYCLNCSNEELDVFIASSKVRAEYLKKAYKIFPKYKHVEKFFVGGEGIEVEFDSLEPPSKFYEDRKNEDLILTEYQLIYVFSSLIWLVSVTNTNPIINYQENQEEKKLEDDILPEIGKIRKTSLLSSYNNEQKKIIEDFVNNLEQKYSWCYIPNSNDIDYLSIGNKIYYQMISMMSTLPSPDKEEQEKMKKAFEFESKSDNEL